MKAISDHAETIVRHHFEQLGLQLVYEPKFGEKHPEFGVVNESGLVWAVIEVKSITPERLLGPRTESKIISTRIRRQMRNANEQFQEASHLPCLLVIDTATTHIPPIASEIAAAMLGSDVYRVSVYEGLGINREHAVDDLGYIHGKNATVPNNTISAVAILAQRIICCDELADNTAATLPDWMEEAMKLRGSKVERSQISKEIDHPLCICSLTFLQIVRNPFAAIEWPSSLVGPFDEVYVPCSTPGRRVDLEFVGSILSEIPEDSILF